MDDEDGTVHRAATSALGEIGDSRAAGRLAAALPDPGLQGAALEALRRLGPAALPELEEAFSGAPPESQRLIVDLVGRMEDRRARKLLFGALEGADPSVRAAAAEALGEGGFLEAVRPLLDLKARDTSPEVRLAAGQALKKLAPH
jgi:HEAT repeat protein